MWNNVISLIAALGVAGLVGAFFQSRFEQQKRLRQQEHELKRPRYLCIPILMLTKLDPAAGMRQVREHRPDLRDLDDVDAEIRTELLNAVLFASDDVIKAIAEFVRTPGYPSYIKSATAMRKDLWNKRTAVDEATLQVVNDGRALAASRRE